MRASILLGPVLMLAPVAGSPALANGFGETRPFAFRSPAERQILLLSEQTRLNYMIAEEGVLGGAADGQTGNSLVISIDGDGDNTIDVGQDNTGDQSIQNEDGEGSNTIGASSPTASPTAAVTGATAALMAME